MTALVPPTKPTGGPLTRLDETVQPRRRPSGIVFHRIDRLPPRPPRTETIAGLLAGGEVAALVGAPGSGKSAVAALAARSLAEGTPFLGRAVLRGATFFVAAERAGEVERRLCAAASPHAAIYVSGARPQLAEPSSIDDLIEAITVAAVAAPPVRLIVLDTAARCFRNLDENSSRDMGLAAEGMARIVEAFPTAALLILHHRDKGNTAMRGSTALLGAIDLELTVQGSGAVRQIEVTKANTIPEGQRFAFRMQAVPAADGLDVITAEAVAASDFRQPNTRNDARLPPDAQTALDILSGLAQPGSVVPLDAWREPTLRAYGDRPQGTKRQAWSKSHHLLIERGFVVLDGQNVSVRGASANRQHSVSADGGKASAQGVSAPPPLRGSADVADAPRRRARKRMA